MAVAAYYRGISCGGASVSFLLAALCPPCRLGYFRDVTGTNAGTDVFLVDDSLPHHCNVPWRQRRL